MKARLRAVLVWMKKRWKWLTAIGLPLLLLGSYPVLVLGYVWIKVAQSDLPGGRNGPLDAYRHTLASAVVAYTLDEKVVDWVSEVMEGEEILTHHMDRHNNRIGAEIGTKARSFWEIEAAVAKQVREGRMMTRDPHQSTWLPESIWSDAMMW